VTVLLCGFDTELTFQKLEDACILLNRGAAFLATNPDWVCPTWYGYVPDCGSVCQMLTRATGKTPVVIGKPQPEMVYLAMEKTGIDSAHTMVVGDRIYTDIACGVNAGVDAALVLSGESVDRICRNTACIPTWNAAEYPRGCCAKTGKGRRTSMKLDNKRTVLVGLAFLSICAFWQMYDSVVPLILTNTFHLNETFSGAIMAADNVLALFLLPFFRHALRPRAHEARQADALHPLRHRLRDHPHEPAAAARQQLRRRGQPVQARVVRRRAGAAARRDGHLPQPRRGAHARRDAQAPALARNAIINLMGAVGGLLYLGVAAALYPNAKVAGLSHVDYQPLFLVVSAIMFLAVGAMFLTVREPKLTAENQALEKRHPEWNLATRTPRAMRCCPRPSSAASASCWPPSPCGSSATTASRPGLRPTSRRSWARGWAGPRPAFSSRRRAPSSRTSPSARWRRRSAAAAPSRAASCC
jgi:hypothetical protein